MWCISTAQHCTCFNPVDQSMGSLCLYMDSPDSSRTAAHQKALTRVLFLYRTAQLMHSAVFVIMHSIYATELLCLQYYVTECGPEPAMWTSTTAAAALMQGWAALLSIAGQHFSTAVLLTQAPCCCCCILCWLCCTFAVLHCCSGHPVSARRVHHNGRQACAQCSV